MRTAVAAVAIAGLSVLLGASTPAEKDRDEHQMIALMATVSRDFVPKGERCKAVKELNVLRGKWGQGAAVMPEGLSC